jgi:hypothetical protein
VSVLLATIALFGCSDDVVCPDLTPQAAVYVSAQIVVRASSTPATSVSVSATADPLFSLLAAYINSTRLTEVHDDGLGLVATLEDDGVLWQPGELCSLKVTTDYGFATSALTLPGAPISQAPVSVAPGETLIVTWNRAPGADYYRISASFIDAAYAPVGAAHIPTDTGRRPAGAVRHEELFSAAITETCYTCVVDSLASSGVIAGTVDAVAGPFPQSGTEGNIDGDAWGFYTVSYADTGSLFSVQVSGTMLKPDYGSGYSD